MRDSLERPWQQLALLGPSSLTHPQAPHTEGGPDRVVVLWMSGPAGNLHLKSCSPPVKRREGRERL